MITDTIHARALRKVYAHVQTLIEKDFEDDEGRHAISFLSRLKPDHQMELAWFVKKFYGNDAFQDFLFELPSNMAVLLSLDHTMTALV